MGCFSRKIDPGFANTAESGDAIVFPGNCTVIGVPEVNASRWVKASFSCNHGPVKLRVSVHDGQSWILLAMDVTADGNRINQAVNLPQGTNKISVARLHAPGSAADTPADVLVEYNGV